jgi:hypothetical protein
VPNHCSNKTYITGPSEEIDAIYSIIYTEDDEKPGLANLMPCPEDLVQTPARATFIPETWNQYVESGEWTKEKYQAEIQDLNDLEKKQLENMEKYGHKDWYGWSLANYGNKWGDYDVHIEKVETDDTKEIVVTYTTAWGPFEACFFKKVSKMFPNCLFATKFSESGMDFVGASVAKNGIAEIDSTNIDFDYSDYDDSTDEGFNEMMDDFHDTVEQQSSDILDGLLLWLQESETSS